jgi:hypothetical protein
MAHSTAPRSIGLFAAAGAALIGLAAGLLTLAFDETAARRAVAASALVAWAIQVIAFSIARSAISRPKRPIMAAWGLGMILRFAAVVVYALLATRVWQLPAVPALVSFVIFLFVSTLLEPFLLHS